MLCLRQGIVMATALCVLMLSVPAQETAITVIMAVTDRNTSIIFPIPLPGTGTAIPVTSKCSASRNVSITASKGCNVNRKGPVASSTVPVIT